MKLIKKLHFYLAYLTLKYKGVQDPFCKTMAEQYIFFKYDKKRKK